MQSPCYVLIVNPGGRGSNPIRSLWDPQHLAEREGQRSNPGSWDRLASLIENYGMRVGVDNR